MASAVLPIFALMMQHATSQLVLGVSSPFTAETNLYLPIAIMAHLDFKKNSDPSLVAQFGPPIISIPNINPNLTVMMQTATDNADSNVGVATALDFFLGRNGQTPIVGLVGGDYSSICMPVNSVASVIHVPQISFGCTNPGLSNKQTYPYFLRTIPPDSIQGLAMWAWMDTFRVPQAAVLYSTDSYGSGLFQAISQIAANNASGYRIVGCSVNFMPQVYDNATARASLETVRAAGTKFIMMIMIQTQAAPMFAQMMQYGMTGAEWQILGSEAVSIPTGINGLTQRDVPIGFQQTYPINEGALYPKMIDMWYKLKLDNITGPAAMQEYHINKWKVQYPDTLPPLTQADFTPPNYRDMGYNSFLFDAYYTFIIAANTMLNAGVPMSEVKGHAFLKVIWATTFEAQSFNKCRPLKLWHRKQRLVKNLEFLSNPTGR